MAVAADITNAIARLELENYNAYKIWLEYNTNTM